MVARTTPGDEYHRYGYAKTAIVHSINKAHAVAILTPHFRRAPSSFLTYLYEVP
jgi:hypothetical protein